MRLTNFLLAVICMVATTGAAEAKDYRAIGTEPFWDLTIGARSLTFDLMGMPKVIQKASKPRATKYGRIYWTKRIQVAIIENQPCSDGMSDYVYRDDVKVSVDGKTFIGCGGPRHLPKGGAR
jgi:uncharacterized membrane protein